MLLPAWLLLAGVAMPLPLAAQEVVQPLPGTTDADKLADLVRQLGRSPRDLSALIEAGDLSARLGDTTAAAALFKRASQIDPENARVKAGIARILVNGEHPGEALRYFDQAERSGLAPATFADDRGLAYDLIGEQQRAQRDYRLALARPAQGNEDEVRRRYALSLGISGRKDEALQQIDALLRKSDRGAWRARAFILAMNGDTTGANRIATTMMPAGMGNGLAAFFTRLPTLSPADRAFAVHFGEVAPTPERIADARLVPPLAALAPDAYARPAPVQVATQAAVPSRNARDRGRGRGREVAQVARPAATTYASQVAQRPAPGSGVLPPAAATIAPTQLTQTPTVAATTSARSSPSIVTAAASPAPAAPATAGVPSIPATQSPAPTVLAATRPASSPVSSAMQPAPMRSASTLPPTAPANLAPAAEARTIMPGTTAPTPPVAVAAAPSPSTPTTTSAADANNLVRAQAAGATGTTQVVVSVPATRPVPVSAASVAEPVQVAAVAPAVSSPPSAPPRADSEDTILARIVANISIPASELGVAPMPGATPQTGATTTLDDAALAAERNAAAVQRRREPAHADQVDAQPALAARTPQAPTRTAARQPAPAPGRRGAKADASTDEAVIPARSRRRATGREQLAQVEDEAAPTTTRRNGRTTGKKLAGTELEATDRKKLTAKQAAAKTKADAKTLADRKSAAEEKKAARAEPERYWIQVAGGATVGDLRKAWASAKAKSSLLAGRAGYTTPLRATNRVVTGPFKTQSEAQAMVNKLSKQGVSAFTFTSEAGQKMTKLEGK